MAVEAGKERLFVNFERAADALRPNGLALAWRAACPASRARPTIREECSPSTREPGAPLGSFKVNYPHALAIDALGNLWVAHEDGAISVSSQDGQPSVPALKTIKHIRALAFGPNNLLYVADSGTNKVHIVWVDPAKATATFLPASASRRSPATTRRIAFTS